jgi:hypothetical protein
MGGIHGFKNRQGKKSKSINDKLGRLKHCNEGGRKKYTVKLHQQPMS